MLTSLRVQHFAIISDISLQFKEGLTVFSGETGAGKSIVIEALGFALGARGDTSVIQEGSDKMTVTAVFSNTLPQSLCQQYQLSEKTLSFSRELDRKGRNKAFINGRAVTVGTLSQLGQFLIDFHGQHEHQSLLHRSVHLTLLDKFSHLEKDVAQFEKIYQQWRDLSDRLQNAKLSAQEKERLLDMCQYQLGEIEKINPAPNEDLQLEQELPKLKHAGKLLENAAEAYEQLYGAEDSAAARVSRATKEVTAMAALDETLTQLADTLNNLSTTLEDAAATIGDYKDSLHVDEQTLDNLLSRHEKIKRLKLKYGPGLSDVLKTAQELRQKIDHLQHAEEHAQDLQNELNNTHQKLLTLAQDLHNKRFESAHKLAALITEQIRPLGFSQVHFGVSVEMDEENLTSTGADQVEFLFSPNPGQSLRPLKDIASGGEISRVMLGLKTVLAPTANVMVFDEVDAGIGGETGWLVGEKLHACAQGRQVLCITHLAQVAAQADHNFYVSKTAQKNETFVSISPLSGEVLTTEIARMLGGNTSKNSAAFSHARELLSAAKRN